MSTFEQLILDLEKVTAQCQPDNTRVGIYDVLVQFNNPHISEAYYPELKQNRQVKGCDVFGFGRNHYFCEDVRRSVYYDGEDVDVSFRRKDFRDYKVLDNHIDIRLRDRRITVTLNEHSDCQNIKEVLG